MDTTKKPRNVISFCSGYAGIERGLELTGIELRTLAYVEIEAYAAANLVAKMETGALVPAPIWSNLKTFPSHLFRDRVDILTGGYPCQPFSAAGKRAGKDDPRHLWPWIRQHIDTMRPVRCFFENVEGHISLGLREVIEDLEELGYKTTFGIFSASEVGAPHQRKRVYILADSDSNGQRPRTRQEQPTRHSAGQRSSDSSSVESEKMVADADSTRLRQSDQKDARQSSEQSDSIGLSSRDVSDANSQELADSSSQGLQRSQRISSNIRQDSEWTESADGSIAECRDDRKQGQWPPEPRLGRVVDGCPDRVDRLRLLGNGVVPQTAAKAWQVLERQLHD